MRSSVAIRRGAATRAATRTRGIAPGHDRRDERRARANTAGNAGPGLGVPPGALLDQRRKTDSGAALMAAGDRIAAR